MKKASIDDLLQLMAQLRDPERGCPWDRRQTFATIAPYTVEEAYEVADAIEREAWSELRDELGDLLFQVVFHARMAEEAGWFGFDDVVSAITEKMTRRHPHVFGDAEFASAEAQTAAWERQKADEREQRGESGILDSVPKTLPALVRSAKLQKRAARVGFDWPDVEGVIRKIVEELEEVKAEQARGDHAALSEEVGDLLFACVNLARYSGVDAEQALRATATKFERRFRFIEQQLAAAGRTVDEASLEEMDALWEEAKRVERSRHSRA